MDTKKYIKLCNDMFFCGAGASATLKNLSGEDVFSYFEVILTLFNASHKLIDEDELLKALKELEPEMRERIQKANEENIKEWSKKNENTSNAR